MVTKDELRIEINRLRAENQSLKMELEQSKKQSRADIDDSRTRGYDGAFNYMYEKWKEHEAGFVARFLKEYLRKHMSLKLDTGYSGSISGTIKIDDVVVGEDDATIITCHNGLEE